jgi:hypothetical protein
VNIPITDPNWYFTEFNWAKGDGFAQAVNPGAYFKVLFCLFYTPFLRLYHFLHLYISTSFSHLFYIFFYLFFFLFSFFFFFFLFFFFFFFFFFPFLSSLLSCPFFYFSPNLIGYNFLTYCTRLDSREQVYQSYLTTLALQLLPMQLCGVSQSLLPFPVLCFL